MLSTSVSADRRGVATRVHGAACASGHGAAPASPPLGCSVRQPQQSPKGFIWEAEQIGSESSWRNAVLEMLQGFVEEASLLT